MSNNRLFSATEETGGEDKATRASLVANDLRNRIMIGALAPEAHLRVQELCARYDVALSPVREALNRLSSEGIVEARDMRGFFVAPVSETDLDELTRTRCWLNETAVRQSMANNGITKNGMTKNGMTKNGAAWEERVLIAYHRLSRLDRRDADGMASMAWNDAHRAFHRALTDGCGSRHLIGYCDQLFVQAERYRNLSRKAPSASPSLRDDEHRAIMEAALAGDADRTVNLLNTHFERTAELCRKVLRGKGNMNA